MFRDVVKVAVQSGAGGRGCVSFRREKFTPFGGPNGGDGGDGGSVLLICDGGLNHLGHLRNGQQFKAAPGVPGGNRGKHGRNADDIEILLPPGTLVIDDETEDAVADLAEPGQRIEIVRGGRGGRGNARFATATRQAPRYAQPGLSGQRRKLRFELKLIAGIGLIGRPNAGKTTLLRALTGSRGKVGAYPFTTLAPNLGIVELGGFERAVIADVPGLVSGAHRGEGLGLMFLRHIERTSALAVLVDVAAEDGEPEDHYREVCDELRLYRADLLDRARILVANKIDLDADAQRLQRLRRLAHEEKIAYCELSAATGAGLETLVDWIREQSGSETAGALA